MYVTLVSVIKSDSIALILSFKMKSMLYRLIAYVNIQFIINHAGTFDGIKVMD